MREHDDVSSSKGSAFPSESSRLTPFTDAIPMSQHYLPRGSVKKDNRLRLTKEEPPTEMKKVPYKIEQ
jgi:hypothetical protein